MTLVLMALLSKIPWAGELSISEKKKQERSEEKEDMSGHFIRDLLTREFLNKACQRSSQVMRAKPFGLIISKWNSGMWAPMSQSIWKARADFQVQWGSEDGTKKYKTKSRSRARLISQQRGNDRWWYALSCMPNTKPEWTRAHPPRILHRR